MTTEAKHTPEPHTVPWHEHWHEMEVLRLQRDELAEALRVLVEFWDENIPVYPGANVVDEVRAALAKVPS